MLRKKLLFSLFLIFQSFILFSNQSFYFVFPQIEKAEKIITTEEIERIGKIENNDSQDSIKKINSVYSSIYSVVLGMNKRQANIDFEKFNLTSSNVEFYKIIKDNFYQVFDKYDEKDFKELLSLAGLENNKESKIDEDVEITEEKKSDEQEKENIEIEESEEEKLRKKELAEEQEKLKLEEERRILEEKNLRIRKARKEFITFWEFLNKSKDIKQDIAVDEEKEIAKEERDVAEEVAEIEAAEEERDVAEEVAEEETDIKAGIFILPIVKSIVDKKEFNKYFTTYINIELLIFDFREEPYFTSLEFSSAGLAEDKNLAYLNAFSDIGKHLKYFLSGGGISFTSGLVLDYLNNGEAIVHLGKKDGVYKGQFLELIENVYDEDKDSISEVVYGRLQIVDVGENISFCKLLYSKKGLTIGDYAVPVKSIGINFDISMGLSLFFYREGLDSPGEQIYSEPVGNISMKISTDRGFDSFRPYIGLDVIFDSPTADLGLPFLIRLEYDSLTQSSGQNFNEEDYIITNLYGGFLFDYYFNRFSLTTGIGLGLGFVPSKGIDKESALKFVPIKGILNFSYFPISNLAIYLDGGFTYHTPLYNVKPWSVAMALNAGFGVRFKY